MMHANRSFYECGRTVRPVPGSRRSRVIAAVLALPLLLSLAASAGDKAVVPVYKDPKAPVDKRVSDLLSRMTVEEKVGQLRCGNLDEPLEKYAEAGFGALATPTRNFGPKEAAERANAIQKLFLEKTRLGIPVIIHDEGLHGLIADRATSFPQAIGLAAAWDVGLMDEVAAAIARESRTRGIHQLLSPVINIARDSRWGRVEETYGEDTYLTTLLGAAYCKALRREGVISTPKHFVANYGDGGRDSNSVDLNWRVLREVYLPPFKAAVQEGRALSIMASYNSLDGRPASSNWDLLTGLLKKEWGFEGYVVSDYGSVAGIHDLHQAAATWEETAKQSIEAGMDQELSSGYVFGKPLLAAVKSGMVSQAVLDEAVSRVLRAKFLMGLFDTPFVDPAAAVRTNDSAENRALARRAAREAVVLLKNEGGVLPLGKDIRTIAVLGPAADEVRLGGYSGFGMKTVSILEGIKAKLAPTAELVWAKGSNIETAAFPAVPWDYLYAGDVKDGKHGLKAEYFDGTELQGTPKYVGVDDQVNFNWGAGGPGHGLGADHFSIRWTGKLVPASSGKYNLSLTSDDGVRFWLDGKLLDNQWVIRGGRTDVIPVYLKAGQAYDIKIEYFENEGAAGAAFGWDYKSSLDTKLDDAVKLAAKADVAVIVCGVTEGEGQDRARLDLPGTQEELIRRTADTGVPVVVVLVNGGAVTMDNWLGKAVAVVEVWYPGEEGGNAVADCLFGDYNPAGRLPITFPLYVGQEPLYYNYKPTGRGYHYVDLSGNPQFAFGYGLSYTTFGYGGLKVVPEKLPAEGTIKVAFDVENTGAKAGDEVVQLYVHRLVDGIVTPVKELAGFKRIGLAPGEKKTMTFELKTGDLAAYGADMKHMIGPSSLEIMAGASSGDIRLRATINK